MIFRSIAFKDMKIRFIYGNFRLLIIYKITNYLIYPYGEMLNYILVILKDYQELSRVRVTWDM